MKKTRKERRAEAWAKHPKLAKFAKVMGWVAVALIGLNLVEVFKEDIHDRAVAEEIQSHNYSYEVIKENDTSMRDRKRIQVLIYSEALPASDREAFLKEVAKAYSKKGYKVSQVILKPIADERYLHLFGTLGDVRYISDGCGLSGQECGGERWKISVKEHQLSEEEQQYLDAFVALYPSMIEEKRTNPDDRDEEERLYSALNEAIAKKIGKSVEESEAIRLRLIFFE